MPTRRALIPLAPAATTLVLFVAGCSESTAPDSNETAGPTPKTPANVEPSTSDPTEASASTPTPDPTPVVQAGPSLFRDVTAAAGVEFVHAAGIEGRYELREIMGPGCAMLDANGDGRMDLFLVQGDRASGATDALYLQGEDGTFTNATEASGLRPGDYGMGVAVGDYDSDGDADLLLTNFGADELWRNEGDGTFVNVTEAAGLDNDLWSVSASFLDYDRDGHLDLFITNYVTGPLMRQCVDAAGRPDFCSPRSFMPTLDRLYRNDGTGRFTDVSVASGIAAEPGPGLGVAVFDFNEDGWPDIFVANDGDQNFLWQNLGDGTFRNVAIESGCAFNREGLTEAGMGVVVQDFTADGRLDLFMTHLNQETNTLYQVTDDGFFVDVTGPSGLAAKSLPYTGFGIGAFDWDHDGDVDLVVANGAVKRRQSESRSIEATEFLTPYAEPVQIFENASDGAFVERSDQAPDLCGVSRVWRGIATGDVDNDGDLDLLLTATDGPARLVRNDASQAGRWLIVTPMLANGAVAEGAEVVLTVGARRMVRRVTSGLSYGSASSPSAHFGLGTTAGVESIEVRWPDGARETFAVDGVDRKLTVIQGAGDAGTSDP